MHVVSPPVHPDGGGGQRDGGLYRDVAFRPHRHGHQGSEQGKQLPGDLLRGGTAQDGLHHQLQHVSSEYGRLFVDIQYMYICIFVIFFVFAKGKLMVRCTLGQ